MVSKDTVPRGGILEVVLLPSSSCTALWLCGQAGYDGATANGWALQLPDEVGQLMITGRGAASHYVHEHTLTVPVDADEGELEAIGKPALNTHCGFVLPKSAMAYLRDRNDTRSSCSSTAILLRVYPAKRLGKLVANGGGACVP
jgi:hypothetical protein